MSTVTHHITAEELWRMPNDQRRELIKGELRVMAPSGFDHGAIVNNFQLLLGNHVKKHRLGIVVGAETGFRLGQNPDTVRGVDTGFVKADRLPATGRPVKYFEGAPDLAVEVLSPGDTIAEVEDKVDDYLAAGCAMIVVINPRRRTISVYKPSGPNPNLLNEDETFDAGDVVPGFRCSVKDVFE